MRKLLGVALLNCCLACSANASDIDRPRDSEMMTDVSSSSGASGAAGASAAVSDDWCAVQAVLAAKCQRCHSLPPQHGAPFPLISYEDTQVLNRRGEPRFVTIETVIIEGFMPPSFVALEPEVEPLSADEVELLVGWCRAGGLPAATDVCEPR